MAQKAARLERSKRNLELEKPTVGPCDDLHLLIAQRAFERFQTRGCRDGYDRDDGLEAEREILSQVPPA
jgi:hypothetical protein